MRADIARATKQENNELITTVTVSWTKAARALKRVDFDFILKLVILL